MATGAGCLNALLPTLADTALREALSCSAKGVTLTGLPEEEFAYMQLSLKTETLSLYVQLEAIPAINT